MRITAITRYKHGEVYSILKRIGWTQAELARRCGLCPGTVGEIINLVKRPTEKQADKIQKALGAAGEYLDVLKEWPETFQGVGRGFKIEQTSEIEMENLLGCREAMMIAAPEQMPTDEISLHDAVNASLSTLSDRDRQVLELRFWNGKTYKEIGKKIKVSGGRVQQIERTALRKLRHPSRIKTLEHHVPDALSPAPGSALMTLKPDGHDNANEPSNAGGVGSS